MERPWYIHQTYFRKKFDENNNTFHVLHNFSMKITLLFMFYAAPQQLAKLSKENTFAVGQNICKIWYNKTSLDILTLQYINILNLT